MAQSLKQTGWRGQIAQFLTRQSVQWGLLFMGLIVSLWAVTQSRNAPQLILLGLLTIISLNFSLPPNVGGGGLVPVVVVSSWLILGGETAVLLTIAAFILAELSRAMMDTDDDSTRWQRAGQLVVYLLPLALAGFAYRQLNGLPPLDEDAVENLTAFGGFIAGYGGGYFLLSLAYWLVLARPYPQFFSDAALSNVAYGFLALPAAILGGFTFRSNGLPAFIIFGLGITVFSVLIRLNWQRRLALEQRLAQFARLNQAGLSLRETLDLPTVLARTRQQVLDLVPADKFDITLIDKGIPQSTIHNPQSDDFTRWVAEHGRVLDLDSGNMHFARRHNLAPPTPLPAAWLGIPLIAAEKVIGVMVLQRSAQARPFSPWNREILLALAGQVSAAIQNARLYSRTDEALARRVEQLQALLDGMEEGVLLLDGNGRIALVNPFAAQLLGQPASDLFRQSLSSDALSQIGYTKAGWQAQLAALQARQAPSSPAMTYAVNLDDGRSQRFITRQETAVRAADGQVMGWLLLFRDVTEERELAEQRADLSRMIVHDLRNPLTTLLTTLDLLPQPDELLANARQSTLDMLDMVDSLMDINRMEAGQLVVEAEAMRLPPLVQQVTERLRPLTATKQISLTFTMPDDLPPVWSDADLVRRVLINLLDNALKFTPAGGKVNGRLQPEAASENTEPGVRFTISDSGTGIPAEFRERVFDRYMRTNPGGAQVRGAGLGLTFCKLAVEAHNGRIWVEDSPDGGSQFVFTLPGIPIIDD
ncbi:MAG: PAS domain-containing protein [Ardenticatenaceae bacterium]|nr:PAS domain-containing protein [Ardenticatenaceae bacterium]